MLERTGGQRWRPKPKPKPKRSDGPEDEEDPDEIGPDDEPDDVWTQEIF